MALCLPNNPLFRAWQRPGARVRISQQRTPCSILMFASIGDSRIWLCLKNWIMFPIFKGLDVCLYVVPIDNTFLNQFKVEVAVKCCASTCCYTSLSSFLPSFLPLFLLHNKVSSFPNFDSPSTALPEPSARREASRRSSTPRH